MRHLLNTAIILQDRLLIKPEDLKLHAGPSKVIRLITGNWNWTPNELRSIRVRSDKGKYTGYLKKCFLVSTRISENLRGVMRVSIQYYWISFIFEPCCPFLGYTSTNTKRRELGNELWVQKTFEIWVTRYWENLMWVDVRVTITQKRQVPLHLENWNWLNTLLNHNCSLSISGQFCLLDRRLSFRCNGCYFIPILHQRILL